MKKNYEWRRSAFIKKLTVGLFALVMIIGLSNSANAQACTVVNIQGGIASGTLSIFATPGNGLACLVDPAGTNAPGDPGCGAAGAYLYTIDDVVLAMGDASLFGLDGEGLGTFEYQVAIVKSVMDTCTIMGPVLWTSPVMTEVMADEGFHNIIVPVGIDVMGPFFVRVTTVSWDGAANRSPSAFLWDGELRPDCRQVVITDGGATQTDHGNYFVAPANGWYNLEVDGNVTLLCDVAIICDDFDSYTTGPLASQSAHWSTWSGAEGGPEDGIVTTDQANSMPNSMFVGNTGSQDVLLLLGNQDAGTYAIDFNVYVPADAEGYFNIQEDEVPGVAWNLEVWFNLDGAAPGVGSFAATNPDTTFAFPHDTWFPIHMVIDLDANLMSFYANGVLVFENFAYEGNIGGLDIFSVSDINSLYMDDVLFYDAPPLSPCGFPTIICDNFDSYMPGFLGDQSDHWSTWSGATGTPEDGIVTTVFANSAPNSMWVGNNGTQDVLLLLGNQTTGTYSIDFMAYVPADAEGYFNIQEDEVAGVAWNLEVWFNRDGAAPGVGSFAPTNPDTTFAFPHDTWFPIHMVIDLDANLMDFYADGVLAFQNFVYEGNIGAIDIFSGSDINNFFMDDVVYDEAEPLSPCGFPTIICDNLDSYTPGFLGDQSDHWSTWSGATGTDEDGLVVTDQANSAPNSMFVGNNGTQDVLLLLGNQSSGSYSIDFMAYVPADAEGYFNIQEDEVAGIAWNLEVWFNRDGAAPGVGSFAPTNPDTTFAFPHDTWFPIHMVIDLDANLMDFYADGVLAFQHFVYGGNIGAIDIFSGSDINSFYMDDVIFDEAEPLSDCNFPTYICDNLDSYNVGGLGEQAEWWSTWSGEFNTPEDGIVTTDQANSVPNSLYISDNMAQDVLLFLGNKTDGIYSVSFNVYIPAGKGGYYNIQEDEVPGVAWNLEVYFNQDGSTPGVGNFPAFSEETFTYPEDEWFSVEAVVSLDQDLLEYKVNGVRVMLMPYLGNLGALDIFSASDNNMMYIDDVIYQDHDLIDAVKELTGLESFDLYPNPSDGNFTIVTGELSGSFLVDMIDLTGRVVYSEQMELSNNDTKAVSIGDLNTGVYILRMVDQTTSEVYTTRVTIQ